MMGVLRTLSGKLASTSTPVLVALGVSQLLLMYYAFGVSLPAIRAEVKDANFEVVDAYFIRPPSLTFANLKQLGPRSRSLYLRLAGADVLIPAVYAPLFGALVAKSWRVQTVPREGESLAWVLPLLPLASAAADYVENLCTLFHIWRLPQHDMGVAWVGTAATFVKYALLNIYLLLIPVGWVMSRKGFKKVASA